MATSASAVHSCFSTTTTRRHLISSDSVLKPAGARAVPLLPSFSHFTDYLSVTSVHQRRNPSKITAVVAQEEVDAEREGAQAEANARLQNTKLYFGNLPYHCDSEQLASVIQEYGSPEMIEVLYDKETGSSRGFALVTMSNMQDCESVISNLNGTQYGGRTLRVNFSEKPKTRTPLYPESEFKLFVGNLSWSVTSEALKQVFRDYGNLVSARVLYDVETGRSRGFGFVCYSTYEEMDAAMESLNGVVLEGRALRISLAVGKKT